MFEHPITTFSNSGQSEKHCREKNLHAQQYNSALNLFNAALLKGRLARFFQRTMHHAYLLYDLENVRAQIRPHGSNYAGMKVVRIDSIIGSEGKVTAFDSGFHPMQASARERWVNLAMAYYAGTSLPPIQLIQVGDAYFVRDGHHRISVARAMGQTAVDAEVIAWNASPPFPWQPGSLQEAVIGFNSV